MKWKCNICPIILLFFYSNNYAQPGFQRTIGEADHDVATDMIVAQDGGFIIAGHSMSFSGGDRDLYLVKINTAGAVAWSRTIGGSDDERTGEIAATPDGGYILTGRTNSFGTGNNIFLVKTDVAGMVQWTEGYGGSDNDRGISVVSKSGGGYMVGAQSHTYGTTGSGYYLLDTDLNGVPSWGFAYDNTSPMGAPASDYLRKVMECTSGNFFYAAGEAKRPGTCGGSWVNQHMCLLKVDDNGNMVWDTYVGGNNCRDGAMDVVQAADGNLVLAGYTNNFGAGGEDVYLIKIDSANGNLLWTQTFGGSGDERAYALSETSDGGFIIAGQTNSFGVGNNDVYLLKTDDNGNLQWSKAYGAALQDRARAVVQTADQGYMVAGYSNSFGGGDNDIYIIKTDSVGNSGCNELTPQTITGTGGVTNSGMAATPGMNNVVTLPNAANVTSNLNCICNLVAIAGDSILCLGDTAMLTAAGNDVYEWSTGEVNDTIYVVPSADATVWAKDTFPGCETADTFDIFVHPPPVADAGPNDTICAGDSIQIGGSPTGPAGSSYSWLPDSSLDNPAVPNPLATPSGTETYVAGVTDINGCSSSDSTTITVASFPFADAGPDDTLCAGESVQIGGSPTGPSNANFAWTPAFGLNDPTVPNPLADPSATTTFVVMVTDTTGQCEQTDSMTLWVEEVNATGTPSNSALCAGESVDLTATGGNLYAWSPSGGLSCTTCPEPVAAPDTTRTYQAVVSDSVSGCSDTTWVTVEVYPRPEAAFDANPACAGDPVIFREQTNDPAVQEWNWAFGDGQSATGAEVPYIYSEGGTYNVTLTVSNGACSDQTAQKVTVYPRPKAEFAATPEVTTLEDATITFNNQSAGYSSAIWHLGNGDTAALPTAEYTYTDTGTFLVMLAVENEKGCADTSLQTVIIRPDFDIGIPNAFSPNGDGLNEIFKPEGNLEGIMEYEMQIWNRWGERVFETTDKHEGWNGRRYNTGQQAVLDTYFYRITLTDFVGTEYEYSGYTYLIK